MSRLSQAELDDIRARNPVGDVAGQYVKLRRAGRRLVGPCPVCGGRATSQRFEVFPDSESWACAVCKDGGDVIRLVEKVDGIDFRAAIERLGGAIAIDPERERQLFEAREKQRLKREKQADAFREAERKRLWEVWQNAAPIHGTPAARYLEGRGLVLPQACPGLRYLPAAAYYHGEAIDERGRKGPVTIHRGPVMLAAFIRPDGRFGGLHFTYLADGDPPAKLELHDPETGEMLNAKKMRGSKSGAQIAFTLPDAPRRMFAGEGIETVGSVYTAMVAAGRAVDDAAFVAAGDLGNLAGRAVKSLPHPSLRRPNGHAQRVPGPEPDPDDSGIAIPDSVAELVLLGDGDSDPVLTQYAMTRAARRYGRDGRTIRIAFAPAAQDFNDVLRIAMPSERTE
jgi:hypothetical protein